MRHVLVTGGNGFIGSYLVERLLSQGIEVLVIDKSIHKPTPCDIRKAKLIEGDVLSHSLLHECLEQVDTCFHLAALSSVPICARDWIFSHENNVQAFNGLLEEFRHLSHPVKLIYASSAAVYGDSEALPLSESEHVIPNSVYGADKLSNEIYAEAVSRTFGIHSIGLRLFNVYGEGQIESNSYSGVITKFKNALRESLPIKILGDGKQTRDFIYVRDVVEAFILAANANVDGAKIYNICSGHSVSILELAQLMMQLSHRKVPITYENARIGDLYHSAGNGLLAQQELEFSARTPIELGLASLLQKDDLAH
ncbi:UDP-glucose 4-epimerase [Legionella massiliensis]|uniref:UDP-glucose 4-epimerase n=1 Tax=Legionella massiliensis TaxID=1034943 RepID=A0A078KUE0_9GAMM|nr:NAD-dependent epimerase/dehydratase family protein [Legionella massiliensis]CDZ78065.1 UDP-glucose 4-epimerase [Legionella massiliensis]CEE13803.1 UDP-glucose 4-epimerase [Legionella massiliensis]